MESRVHYRFYPTDQEIICYYLRHKMLGENDDASVSRAITVISLHETDPWDLPPLSRIRSEEGPWYFFYQLDMSSNGEETNRTAPSGYWQCIGCGQEIRANGRVIGVKKILKFHGGQDPTAADTNWVMHEYHLRHRSAMEREYVIGKLKMKY